MANDLPSRLLITCEHASNRVPPAYREYFRRARGLLATHRAYDIGALDMAKVLSRGTKTPLIYARFTRLLVEVNRSLGHPQLWSECSCLLPPQSKEMVLNQYYYPYRQRVEQAISEQIKQSRIAIHISLHTFTPVLAGALRRADVGLLYDPSCPPEKRFCHGWKSHLKQVQRGLRVRRNYPYLGRSDGFTTHLRRRFPPDAYLGIELEVNQVFWDEQEGEKQSLLRVLTGTLKANLRDFSKMRF